MAKNKIKKAAVKIIMIALYTYIGFMVILYTQQRSMLYFPGGQRPVIEDLTSIIPTIIPVKSDENIEFKAWHWAAKEQMPTLIFFHGNGQDYQYWVNKLMHYQKRGFGVLFTDYRGYGGVNGKPTEEGIYRDARAHINAILETGLKEHNLIFYGESLGTGVATQMATEFTPKAVIFESAYSGTNEVAKGRYGMFPIDLLMKDQYRSIEKIHQLTMPKFFIHAENDNIIPIAYALKLYKAAPEPKTWVTIEKAGHNNLYDYGAQLHILEFLSTLMSSNKYNKEQ
ncbi:MAG: alpha/beta hydrolase [Bdellovibrionales bacterium]